MLLTLFESSPACTACPMHKSAKSVCVPTVELESFTPDDAPGVLFIGQNPGFLEDVNNEPFVGPSGDILRKGYIDGLSLLERVKVYLSNTLRCGPNSKPPAKAYRTCFPLWTVPDVDRILERHSRVAIVGLGAPATQMLFKTYFPKIKKAVIGTSRLGLDPSRPNITDTLLMTTYHPAALLPNRNPGLHDSVAAHLEILNRWIDSIDSSFTPTIVDPDFPNPP